MPSQSHKTKFSLKGRSAIVTGGAGILGKYFCEGLAEFGAQVAVLDKDAKAARACAATLKRRYRVKTLGIGCDVSDSSQASRAVKTAAKALGPITILHNNAATKTDNLETFFEGFERYNLKTWKKVMAVNIDGMFLMARETGKHMLGHGRGGSIIQTASIYGVMGPDQRIYKGSLYGGRPISLPAVYSASKGAVVALTKHLACYWADKGIRVNTLTPGGVESGQNETFKQKYSNRIPLGRMARADEMVGALVFLASDASSYITGQNIIIDGGLSAW